MAYPLQLQTFLLDKQTISLFVPEPTAVQQAYERDKKENGETPFPYWAQVWPAALALAEFLLQNQHYIKNKTVLELAAGLGLPSLVSASFAQQVTCTDYIADAVAIAQQSAQHAGLTHVQCQLLNWHHLPDGLATDVLLLSDVNYVPHEFDELHKIMNRFLQKGTIIILSTPQRLMAKSFIQQLLPFCVWQQQVDVPQQAQNIPITILVLQEN